VIKYALLLAWQKGLSVRNNDADPKHSVCASRPNLLVRYFSILKCAQFVT
jgi:hypothetical protein